MNKNYLLCGAFLLIGCQNNAPSPFEIETLREPKALEATRQATPQAVTSSQSVVRGPESDFRPGIVRTESLGDLGGLPDKSFKASYNNIPIAAFINEVFGEQLQRSFTIEPNVQALTDLVTLRLVDEVTSEELLNIVQSTLASFGVSIENRSGVLNFAFSSNVSPTDTPLVVSGDALPEVPPSHRPIFMFVPVNVVSSNTLRGWLSSVMLGQNIRIQNVVQSNALLLQGKRTVVQQALDVIRALDQPAMSGKFSALFQPRFTEAEILGADLIKVLASEGYQATSRPGSGNVIIIPLGSMNKLAILAGSDTIVDRVIEWAELLDQENTAGIESGIFSYELRNVEAAYVVELLDQLSKPASSGDATNEGPGQFIADKNRNAIVYSGNGGEWIRLLDTIRDMDQPVPSVLVEVVLAEVTLNDVDETGFEFVARSGDVTFSTLGGLGLGGNGLTATLNRAGETRAVLNAFYENDRANIRSRPRLLVKSGQQASIDIGNEIPFITSTSQSVENPDSPVIQTVQYRKTGVILEIEPIVHSSGFVDVRIAQELSEAQQNSTSSIDSPTVFNRSLETTVTLRDGGSVLLGGLISESNSDSVSGIKGLGSIPGIGRLFRRDSNSTDRTELIMMVIPYIIENPDEAAEITDRVLEVLELSR